MVQVVSAPTIFEAKDRHGHEFRAMLSVESRRVRVALEMHSLDGNGWVLIELWIGNDPPTLDQLISLRDKLKQWGIQNKLRGAQNLEEKLLDEMQAQTSLRLGKSN